MTTKSSCLIGFGSNYYRAMGGSEIIHLTHDDNDDDDVVAYKSKSLKDSIIDVKCTATASIFLSQKGKIYQSGTLHGKINSIPLQIKIELPLKCVEIAAGRHFCVGRMEGGLACVSWGAGHFGQLGHGPNVCSLDSPKVIQHLLPHYTGSPVKQVAVGSWHGLALLESGKLYAWGSNRRWQCGIKRLDDHKGKTPPTLVYPRPIDTGSIRFTKIACGKSHSVALTTDALVYTWGASHFGQCGHSTRRSTIAPPRLVEALQKVVIVDVSAGDAHTLALTGGGRVFSWGNAMEGQLGLGPAAAFSRPKLVGDLDFVAICAGQEWKQQQKTTTQATTTMRTNVKSSITYMPSPPLAARQVVDPPPDVPFFPCLDYDNDNNNEQQQHVLSSVPKIVSIEAAGSYSVAVSSAGHVYTWGYNDVGVLGLPRPHQEQLVLIDPPVERTSGRLLQAQTFDSRHNVLLPRRVDALSHLFCKKVAGGPSHMWCLCEPRSSEQNNMMVGRTLYEVQEERRQRGLQRLRQQMSVSSTSASLVAESKKSDATSIVENGEKIQVGSKPRSKFKKSQDGKDKASFVESEEEDDDDITTTEETNEEARPKSPNTFTAKAQAEPPKPKSGPGRPIARLLRRFSSKNKQQMDTSSQKKGRTRKVLKKAICKSERESFA